MEHYLIEEAVAFYPTEKILRNIRTSEEVTISLLAAAILEKLIAEHGEVVMRETLFSEILDPRGGTSTNNNLNQYMMNLRKQLAFLGIESDVITTVPRIGFLIPAAISIIGRESVETKTSQAETSPAAVTRSQVAAKLWIALMVLVTLSALVFEWNSDEHDLEWAEPPLVSTIPLNHNPQCQVSLIPSGITVYTGEVPDYQTTIDEADKMKCDAGVVTRYFLSHSAVNETRYRSFVLRCTDNPGSGPTCFSNYLVREQ